MSEEFETLDQKLFEIHGGKQLHTIDDFVKIADLYLRYSEIAFEKNILYPHQYITQEVLKIVNSISEVLRESEPTARNQDELISESPWDGSGQLYISDFGSFEFYFFILDEKHSEAIEIVKRYEGRLSRKLNEFSALYDKIYNEIELEILPDNISGEKDYLAQGRLIVQTGTDEYHVYKISRHWCEGHQMDHVEFEILTERGYSSVEEALNDPHDVPKKMLGTIAVVRNPNNYPMEDSVIPILMLKYEGGLQGREITNFL